MQTGTLEHANARLLDIARRSRFAYPPAGDWRAELVPAHVVASSRMLAAASAELLAGRIPVLDNRPTQSTAYLEATAAAAGPWADLVSTAERAGRDVLVLAAQLEERHLATRVPTIIVDAGSIRVERPVPFDMLLDTTRLAGHAEQRRALARWDGTVQSGSWDDKRSRNAGQSLRR